MQQENKLMKVHVLYTGVDCSCLSMLQRCLAVPQIEGKSRMVPPLYLRMIHIGKLIEEELRRQERTVTWFAKKLCCERTNVYSIFKRQSIDTELLSRISRILHYNFFQHYHNEIEKCDFSSTLP